ncbi:type II toxin-antitoxin system YhaV family toxin [Acidithiobacillus sp. MC6.1]|nr:type II toxin-antitoxin system YhaV family toxin [Acidithiobacillus sp. MC6.1]
MQHHGWTLFFHPCLVEQLLKLKAAADRASATDPAGFEANANVKLYLALSHLILEVVSQDPGNEEYRQGHTMGQDYRHWRRAKIGRRFRLFFRYDSKARIIVSEVSLNFTFCRLPNSSHHTH